MVDAGKQIHVVAEAREDGHDQLEVVRRHLRSQKGVARFFHLLGELHALEFGRGGVALLEVLAGFGRGLFGEALGRFDGVCDGLHGGRVGASGGLLAGTRGLRGGNSAFGFRQKLFHIEAACGAFGLLGLRFGLFIGLVFQCGQQAAHADARGAKVRHLVDLEHRVDLPGAFQNLLHLVGGEGVQAAAEAVQLDEVEVAPFAGDFRGGIQAGVIHPLVHQANRALKRAQMRNGIFGEHGQPEAREQLGNRVVDFGVVVIGAPRQHDAMRAGLFHPYERFRAFFAHVGLEGLVFGPGGIDCGIDFGLRRRGDAFAHEFGVRLHELYHQAFLQVVLFVVRQPRVQELRVALAQLVDVQAQRLGVACHDGAIEMVAGRLVFLALPLAARKPDEVGVLVEQVHDVAVRKLRRIAHAFRGHAFDAGIVGFFGRRVGKHHAPAELREEGEPERVVFVHGKRARNADRAARSIFRRERFVIKQAVALVFVEVGNVVFLVRYARALFASVARDEAAVFAGGLVAAEIVHGEQAVVRASLAAHGLVRGSERAQCLGGKHRRAHGAFAAFCGANCGGIPVACEQGRAIGAHVARDIGTNGVHAGELLECAQHGVVEECSALHDDLLADFFGVADFDDLEQGVFDDGNRQARGDVAHGGAFLLRLLHARIHEHGAAAAQIDGVFGGVGRFREFGHVEIQARGEALDEASAARRAGLVEHDVVDDAVFHAQAFHVLAADVQDELDAGQHFLGAAQVRDGLDLARVDAQRLEQQALAVAGHGRVPDGHLRLAVFIARQLFIHAGDRALGRSQNVALVIGVKRP